MKEYVFIACPTYDGRIDSTTARALFVFATEKYQPMVEIGQFSLLNMNCNRLWCAALNSRNKDGVNDMKWFAMLHADIVPEMFWVDKLIAIAEKENAVMVSAVSPMKDNSGRVSTGVGNPIDDWCMYKLSFDDLKKLPKTFDISDIKLPHKGSLLLNTGCMIVRIDQPWSEKLIFKTEERITVINEEFVAQADSEDWNFSRQVSKHGRIVATQAVSLHHIGNAHWANHGNK